MKRKAESWYNEKERGSISAFQGDGVPPRRRHEGVINELNEFSELSVFNAETQRRREIKF